MGHAHVGLFWLRLRRGVGRTQQARNPGNTFPRGPTLSMNAERRISTLHGRPNPTKADASRRLVLADAVLHKIAGVLPDSISKARSFERAYTFRFEAETEMRVLGS